MLHFANQKQSQACATARDFLTIKHTSHDFNTFSAYHKTILKRDFKIFQDSTGIQGPCGALCPVPRSSSLPQTNGLNTMHLSRQARDILPHHPCIKLPNSLLARQESETVTREQRIQDKYIVIYIYIYNKKNRVITRKQDIILRT